MQCQDFRLKEQKDSFQAYILQTGGGKSYPLKDL